MSFTGVSSILYSIKKDERVKIKDFLGLQKYIESIGYPPAWIHTYDIIEKLTYPPQTWKYLTGISSYEIKNDCCMLDRVGFNYSKKDFINMWGMISTFTEPFYFYHSPRDGAFSNSVDIAEENTELFIYKLVCVNGIVEVHEIDFKSESKTLYSSKEE
jgi:hypothetical protein